MSLALIRQYAAYEIEGSKIPHHLPLQHSLFGSAVDAQTFH